MKVIAGIKDAQIIKNILNHLDLWDVKLKPTPHANVYPPWRAPLLKPSSFLTIRLRPARMIT
jgi:hypothetical protein